MGSSQSHTSADAQVRSHDPLSSSGACNPTNKFAKCRFKETGSLASCHSIGGCLESPSSETAAKIIAHLEKAQRRDVSRDIGNGSRSAREISQAVGMNTVDCRALLRSMAAEGRVRLRDCMNGQFWSSTNPLPWEPGGSIARERARLDELWAGPLTLIVQSVWVGPSGTTSRDEKAYPAALRYLADAHVERENRLAESRRRSDRMEDRHLQHSYVPPPSYRLVCLADPAVIAKATGQEVTGLDDVGSRADTKANSGLNTINEVSQ